MPDKSDIYFAVSMVVALLLGWREVEHRFREWRVKRQKRKPRHRRK